MFGSYNYIFGFLMFGSYNYIFGFLMFGSYDHACSLFMSLFMVSYRSSKFGLDAHSVVSSEN